MKKIIFRGFHMALFFLCSIFIYGQTISGIVTDASGPLPGANVLVKGTSLGTITDVDGSFTLSGVEPGAVLEISYIGYTTVEVPVDGQSVYNIVLKEDHLMLDQVVVTGYSAQTRGDISGSVSSVNMDDAVKQPMVNAAEALQGRVSGVTVTGNGRPGSSPKIVIRGFGTSNNTNPLYIIDGVQTEDPSVLASINPSDIKQMNVLKDGAAAIYGARASNGVIIITTKNGGYNMDKATVSIDAYTGYSQVSNIPEMLNAQQHADMIWQSLKNSGSDLTHVQYGSGANPVVPTMLQGTNLPEAGVNVTPGGTKWVDEIFQTGKTHNVSVSLQNGTESGKYFMSVGVLRREGVQLFTGFDRANARVNSEYKINDRIRIGEHMNVSFANTQSPNANQVNIALRSNPLVPVYDNAGKFAGGYSNSNQLGNTGNPVAALTRAKDDFRKNFRAIGDVYFEADILENLTAKSLFSGSLSNGSSRGFTALNPEAPEPLSTNTLREGTANSKSWTWTNTLNFKKEVGNHFFNVLAGIEALKVNDKGFGVSRTGYLFETPDFYLLGNGSGVPNVSYAYDATSTLYSLFGTVNYSFADKYFATATLRRDKSSRFKGDNQADIFPAFSVGWALHKEDFFPKNSILSRMKLKASYGELGNQTLPANNPTINISGLSEVYANYAFDGSSISTGALLTSVGNPDLRWETSKSTNIGVDLGFFNDALAMSIEWFNIKTADLIVRDNSLIPSTGPDADPPLVNTGSVKNTGIDFGLGYHNSTSSGFNYYIDANLSSYKNEVTDWINAFQSGRSYRNGAITRTEEGFPISYFYGRVVEGIFQNAAEVSAAADQNFVNPEDGVGRFRYADLNGDGIIDDEDRTMIGSPHPDFTYGINIGGDFKGFDVSLFFQGSQGNDIYNYEKIFTDFPTFVNNNRSVRVLNAWSPSNTDTDLPALSTSILNNETTPNSYFVEDGSYFRLRNAQIGYTLGSDLTNKIGLGSLRLYVQGANLLTLTGYSGLDPEVNTNSGNLTLGVDFNTFPISKIITFGINAKF